MPLAHALIKVGAADHAAVVDFYSKALKPLGLKQLRAFPNGMTGFGDQSPEWWVAIGEKSRIHIAFQAPGKSTTRHPTTDLLSI